MTHCRTSPTRLEKYTNGTLGRSLYTQELNNVIEHIADTHADTHTNLFEFVKRVRGRPGDGRR